MADSKDNKKSSVISFFAPEKPGTFKLYFIQFFIIFVACLVIWPIFDIIYSSVFTHTAFTYNAHQYVLQPLIFAIIFAIISYLIDLIRFKIKESKK